MKRIHLERVALAIILVLSLVACGSRPDHVIARRVDGTLPRTDPFAEAWEDLPEYEATLQPQNVATPMLATGSVDRLRIRALHDGSWVAFRLEWEDDTDDHNVTTSTFSDACAIQFPATRTGLGSPMMGNDGAPVDIVYFRASWAVEDNMAELYPNMPPIYHPPEAAAEGEARTAMEAAYRPSYAAHNPTVDRPEGASVIAFSAAGFGTLSPGEGGLETDGGGTYRDGHWYVILARSIGEAGTSVVAPGQRTSVAFAVWNGSNGEVGSRKNRSDWIDCEIEGGGS
jgi:DMSO reductase family type II enzyme heme b subunit